MKIQDILDKDLIRLTEKIEVTTEFSLRAK